MEHQAWFEMRDIRQRSLDRAAWIPLRSNDNRSERGKLTQYGYHADYLAVGSAVFDISLQDKAMGIGWSGLGLGEDHNSYVDDDGTYISADSYQNDGIHGVRLVLDQHLIGDDFSTWHLSQDLVVALGLKREGDSWVRPEEGYFEVARLRRDDHRKPSLLEIYASHLKDYLCARKMGLLLTMYRSREEVVEHRSHIDWAQDRQSEETPSGRWEGTITAIHEGGMHYGSKMAVFHAARTDIDLEEDVPEFGPDGNVKSERWEKTYSGRKLYRISGELWSNAWIGPSTASPIVRRDKVPPIASFIIDAAGTRETAATLVSDGRWLWFKPQIVVDALARRGGGLEWYTLQTGGLSLAPRNDVHFGINRLGLVNVFAKDITALPNWQQQIWSGYNVPPDGGVSKELTDSQIKAEPAETLAPESFINEVMEALAANVKRRFDFDLLQHSAHVDEILPSIHRFRVMDRAGLYALAKDLTRVFADRLDAKAIQKVFPPPSGESPRKGLKALQGLFARGIGDNNARQLLGPLFGIYDLRLADAHPAGSDVEDAIRLACVDPTMPFVEQGRYLLQAFVHTVGSMADILVSRPQQ